GMRLDRVQPAHVREFLDAKQTEGLKPQTVRHLRNHLSAAFRAAIERDRWMGPNPVKLVKPPRVAQQPVGDYLRTYEVPYVLAELPQRYRPLFATAIYAGLRKGELRALRRADVDLERRLVLVRRSGERSTTKGGHADAVPVHPELVPFLERALETASGELVFP